MFLFRLLLLLNLYVGFAGQGLEKLIEGEVHKKFGDLAVLRGVKLLGREIPNRVDRVEIDAEYGKSRAIAYIYEGDKRYQAVLDIYWTLKVFVAKEDIPKGAPLKPDMFYQEERLVKSVPSDLRISPEELENYTASTRIIKGTILRRSLMEEPPAVKAGDQVEAVFRSGSVEVRFSAVALDTGKVGSTVRIKRDGKVLRGRVVARGLVEVKP